MREILALDEAGFFNDQHVELIGGEIFEMIPLYLGHGRVAAQLLMAIGSALDKFGDQFEALTPVSAQLDAVSLPEADIVVATPSDGTISSLLRPSEFGGSFCQFATA